jgi:hypothetical protein
MKDEFYSRVEQGEHRPGLVLIAETLPIGRAIEVLLLFALVSTDTEWDQTVVYLPQPS